MAHVAEWKKGEVADLKDLAQTYPVVGVVNLGVVPGRQIQKIRAAMRGEDTIIRMSRKRIMGLALKKVKKEKIEGLIESLTGQSGLIFSNSNPFKIYKDLEKFKARAPARPNTVASKDISVTKGETPFPPGPILSELQRAGIPAAIQGGKVVIKEDRVLVRAGEKISSEVANALSKLEIEPLEIKLDLLAAYEDGVIYTPDLLEVDIQKIMSELSNAYKKAVNLAVNSAYLTKETAAISILRAETNARNLAINAGIYAKGVMKSIITIAQGRAVVIKSLTNDKIESMNSETDKSTEVK